jgi:hypothetical protein
MEREFLNVLLSPAVVEIRTAMCDSELHISDSCTASHVYRLQSSFYFAFWGFSSAHGENKRNILVTANLIHTSFLKV